MLRHKQVQHEKIGYLRVDQRECLLAGGSFAYNVAVLAQGLVHEGAEVRVVVHDQDVVTAQGVPTRMRSQRRARQLPDAVRLDGQLEALVGAANPQSIAKLPGVPVGALLDRLDESVVVGRIVVGESELTHPRRGG